MSEAPITIIELGDVIIKCIIFNIDSYDDIEILSVSSVPSDGIKNGVIVNLSKASNTIRSCISLAEKKTKIILKKVNVVFEQSDFLCTKFSKHKKISGSKIYKEDIEFLLKEGKKQIILNDKNQTIIHIFNYNYSVDGKKFIKEPIGVYANFLKHEMTFVTAPKNNLKNIKQAFIDCDIEIERMISKTFALGVKLLKYDELENGCALIDVGHENTSLGLFKNLALSNSITIPIGINHITKDISKVCSLNLEESETIRNNIDFSLNNSQNIFDEENFLKKIYFINSNIRKISKSLILDVIKARLDEIFEKIKKQIEVAGLNFNPQIKLFLSDGSSDLLNLEKYCEIFFETNVKKIEDKNIFKTKNDLEKNLSACWGGIKIIKDGWETEAIPINSKKNTENKGFLRRIFENVM